MKRIEQALERAREEALRDDVRPTKREPTLRSSASEGEPIPTRSPSGVRRTTALPQRRVRSLRSDVVERNRLRLGHEADATAQAYRVLRTRTLQWLDAHGRSTVAMISASDGDGKTLSAANLALSIANDTNHTVLLVDFDLRSPSVHECFGLDVVQGLERFFAGEAKLEELIVSVNHPRLAVLPCLKPVASASELLTSAVVRELVVELESRYADRVVIFDLPPALSGDDAIAFLPLVDAALVVIGEGSTRREQLERLSDVLRDTPVIGSILNRASRTIDPFYG